MYWDGSRDASPGQYELLPRPSLVMRQMLASIRVSSFIVRLISSSVRDKQHAKSGKGAFDKEAKKLPPPTAVTLQRALRKHVIGSHQVRCDPDPDSNPDSGQTVYLYRPFPEPKLSPDPVLPLTFPFALTLIRNRGRAFALSHR